MRILSTGQLIFASAIAGLGVLSLVTGHFAGVWQPVPARLPAREVFAHANGVLMLALGIGLFVRRAALIAAVTLTVYLLIWFVALRGPIVLAAPLVPVNWSGFGETGTMIVGGLSLIAALSARNVRFLPNFLTGAAGVRIAAATFAVAAFLMSLANFPYPKANADFPPGWIPHWYGWGFLVGGAYVATGLSVLSGICAKLSTYATAVMMSLLTLGCWVSFVVQAPADRLNWTGLLISSALTGVAWMVAESYRGRAWLEVSRTGLGRSDTGAPRNAA